MRANVIVRDWKGKIVQTIDTSVDDQSVNTLVSRLKNRYGESYTIDREQIELARRAASQE